MAKLEEFFEEEFPGLSNYKVIQKEFFLFVSFICDLGKIFLAISNKDNHIYDLFFLNPHYIFNIERELKIYSLNPSFVEYKKTQKGDKNIGEI